MTVSSGAFEWDSNKARANQIKHGISFEEAVAAFDDPYFLEIPDDEHSTQEEQRIKGIGIVHDVVVVATVFTAREKRVRIISARYATKKEEKRYYAQRFGY